MSADEFSAAELHVIGAMRRAAKTAPDMMAVAALQELACLYVKIEPLLPERDKATLFGIGAYLSNVGKAELAAEIQGAMLMAGIASQRKDGK